MRWPYLRQRESCPQESGKFVEYIPPRVCSNVAHAIVCNGRYPHGFSESMSDQVAEFVVLEELVKAHMTNGCFIDNSIAWRCMTVTFKNHCIRLMMLRASNVKSLLQVLLQISRKSCRCCVDEVSLSTAVLCDMHSGPFHNGEAGTMTMVEETY